MLNVSPGNESSHYNPDQPRDWHGRWTNGASSWENNPLRNPSAIGRANTLLGHARAGAWQKDIIREFHLPTEAEAGRFSRLLAAWNAASHLDDDSFRDRFTRGLVDDPATVRRLRQAAAASVQAQTIGQMIEASYPLTAAIKDIGGSRWPTVLDELQGRVGIAPDSGKDQDTQLCMGVIPPLLDALPELLPDLTMWAFRALLWRTLGRKPPATPSNPLTKAEIERIQSLPKGYRPNPDEYLPQEYREAMLHQFDNGATKFMLKKNYDKYGIGNTDGTSFFMPREEADRLLEATKGNPRELEKALGLEPGSLSNDQLVRIDIPNPRDYGLRLPSGNERGANKDWIPGGKLPDGESEAIIDGGRVPPGAMKVSSVRPRGPDGHNPCKSDDCN